MYIHNYMLYTCVHCVHRILKSYTGKPVHVHICVLFMYHPYLEVHRCSLYESACSAHCKQVALLNLQFLRLCYSFKLSIVQPLR